MTLLCDSWQVRWSHTWRQATLSFWDGAGPHTCRPHFTECVAQTSHPYQLAFSPVGIILLVPTSPWISFREIIFILFTFCKSLKDFSVSFSLSRMICSLADIWDSSLSSAWISCSSLENTQTEDRLLYGPATLGQRAVPSCWVTCWQSPFYILLRYKPRFHITERPVFSALPLSKHWSKDNNPELLPLVHGHHFAICFGVLFNSTNTYIFNLEVDITFYIA